MWATLCLAILATRLARAGGGAATDSYENVGTGAVWLGGLVDTYLLNNFNQPASGTNQLRAYDLVSDDPTLNYARLTLAHKPGLFGFRLDAGLGGTSGVFERLDPELSQYPGQARFWSHIQQAFITWSVPRAATFLLDLGKFDTPVGLEDNITPPNWNYSRSFLYTWAEPTLHLGARLTWQPVTDKLGVSLFWVNGWNTNFEDGDDMRAFAGALTWRPRKGIEVDLVYIGGLERAPTDVSNPSLAFRNLVDGYVEYSPTERVSVALTSDYGHDAADGGVSWGGITGYVQGSPLDWLKWAVRTELYLDPDGFTTGQRQTLVELTGTADATVPLGRASLVIRVEYRHDQSSALAFETSRPMTRSYQDTLAVALVAGN